MADKREILIADDSDMNRKLMKAFVDSFGYRSVLAVDGKDTLQKLTKKTDLILLDVMMPVMDGLTATKIIRKHKVLFDIPIVMVTSLTDKDSRIKAVRAGANDFITKPVDKNELQVRVASLLKMKDAQDQIKRHKEVLEQTVRKRTAELQRRNKQLHAEIAERKASEERLRRARTDLAEAQRIARLGFWVWDFFKDDLSWSDEIYRIVGMAPTKFKASFEEFLKTVHPDDRELVRQTVKEAMRKRQDYALDHRIVLEDGSTRIVHESGKVERDQEDNPIRMIGTVQDITERKAIEKELEKLSMAIEQSTSIVLITDRNGKIEYVNSRFEEVTGYSKLEAIDQSPRIISSGDTPQHVYEDLWSTIMAGGTWRGDFKNKKKNGQHYWVRGLVSPISNDRGEVSHFLSIQEDISEKILAEKRIKYLATFDATTGLMNRKNFIQHLDELISDDRMCAVIIIDFDGFKLIKEVYGHGIGDEFVKSLTEITKNVLAEADRNNAIVGRIGEDEIAVCIQFGNGRDAMALAEKIRKKAETYKFSRESLRTTISAGIVEFPEHGQTSEELLRRADAALYRSKKMGKNRCHLYSEGDNDIINNRPKITQMRRIVKALEEDRFEPWFQPIMNLRHNTMRHYEALARMRGTNGDVILPGSFIGVAEAMGLVRDIDRVIIEKTIRYQSELLKDGIDISFSMNISGKHMGDDQLFNFIKSTIEKTGANSTKLVFEITETAAIEDLERAKQFMNNLRSMGCRFSLDDFGVGFTSFMYLREMQVNFLKIDGMFIRRLYENKHDQGIVQAISTIARSLNIKTVGEFVEKLETLELLRKFGVDYAQGFLVGKPAPQIQMADTSE